MFVLSDQLTPYAYEGLDKENECITATCNSNQLKRAYRSCENNFYVTCGKILKETFSGIGSLCTSD